MHSLHISALMYEHNVPLVVRVHMYLEGHIKFVPSVLVDMRGICTVHELGTRGASVCTSMSTYIQTRELTVQFAL